VPDAIDAAELLDVDVNQLAGASTPKAAATAAMLQPSARRRIISNRPSRVVLAFW
jgi:hypothetical protein